MLIESGVGALELIGVLAAGRPEGWSWSCAYRGGVSMICFLVEVGAADDDVDELRRVDADLIASTTNRSRSITALMGKEKP